MKVTFLKKMRNSARKFCCASIITSVFFIATGRADEILRDAVQLEIGSQDMQSGLANLSKTLSQKTLGGSIDQNFETKVLRVPLKFSGMTYEFKIKSVTGNFKDNQLEISAELSDLKAMIGKVNVWSDRYLCENIPITSKEGSIPFQTTLSPRVTAEGLLELDIQSVTLNLDSSNFSVASPEKCDLILGFNTLVRYATPYVAARFRTTIQRRIAETIQTQAAEISKGFAKSLNFEFGLPFSMKPLRPFFITFSTRPTSVKVTPNFFSFGLGLGLKIEVDDTSLKFKDEAIQTDDESSGFGIGKSFFNYVFREINKSGLISTVLIDEKNTGADPKYFKVDYLGALLFTKLNKVADVTSPVALRILDMGEMVPVFTDKPTGTELAVQFKTIKIEFFSFPKGTKEFIKYGTLVLSLNVPLSFELDEKDSMAAINIAQLQLTGDPTFEFNTLFPGVGVDHKLRSGRVEGILDQLNEVLKDPLKNNLIKVKLPNISVGSQQVKFKKLQSKDDFFKLKFAID